MHELPVKVAPVVGGAGRHEALVHATCEVCFAVLRDVGTYPRWWTLARAEMGDGGSRLVPGVTFRVEATLSSGDAFRWGGRVVATHAPHRLEVEYDDGDLVGGASWELQARTDGTLVTHVTTGVRAALRGGRALLAYRALVVGDALPGLVRLLGGAGAEVDDVAWREQSAERVEVLLGQPPAVGR